MPDKTKLIKWQELRRIGCFKFLFSFFYFLYSVSPKAIESGDGDSYTAMSSLTFDVFLSLIYIIQTQNWKEEFSLFVNYICNVVFCMENVNAYI